MPDQLDCPWCGCGWLFSCAQCGRAFTFAKAVKIDYPLDEIVAMDLSGRGFAENAEVAKEATEFMRAALSDVDEDRTYVYLDGSILTLDASDIKFEGWHARHDLPVLPHKLELTTPGELGRVLGDSAYWWDRKREE